MNRSFEIRGWHVFAGMLGFFAIVIGVNVTFATVALRSFPGEDVRRSYLQGVHFNDRLAERRRQSDLGWRARAALKHAEGGAVVEVILSGRDGAPLRGIALAGALQWPTDARHDRALAFEAAGDGRYVARLGALPNGRWRLRARAADGRGGARDFEAELQWPA